VATTYDPGVRRPWTRPSRPVRTAATLGLLAAGLIGGTLRADSSASVGATAKRLTTLPRSFDVVMGGDILTEKIVNDAAARAGAATGVRYDFRPMFAPVAPIVSAADLAICHMELPTGRAGDQPGSYGRSPFGGNLVVAPHELAAALADTGFDRCSTASNHSYDAGIDGIASTIEALDEVGISHTGTARTPAEADPGILVVNGVKVAHLSYTRFTNTQLPPEGWRVNYVTRPAQVAAGVDAARAAGAEVVIVSLHLIHELLRGPLSDDTAFVDELTSLAHIDLLLQHGPHVVHATQIVNGTLVHWSVGNFVSGMGVAGRVRYDDPRALDGLLASVRFTETSPGRFSATSWPVLVCNEVVARTVRAPVTQLADPATSPSLAREMQGCIDRTIGVVPDLK
jgi:hypothetical protein